MKPPESETCIHVLNHGFVRLVRCMGDDETIAESARVSYAGVGSESKKKSSTKALIRYLYANLHTSPFEQVVFQFHCKMPIFVARQWVRHRTARLNEISGRYAELPEEFYDYCLQGLPMQSTTNKQGSEGTAFTPEQEAGWLRELDAHIQESFDKYHTLLDAGVSNEIARCHLPLSTYTEWYWQMDLHNLFHFLKLRMDAHAQAEIRVFAQAIYQLIKPLVPLATEAFEDYELLSVRLSKMEQQVLSQLILEGKTLDAQEMKALGMTEREILGYERKLDKILSKKG